MRNKIFKLVTKFLETRFLDWKQDFSIETKIFRLKTRILD